MGINLFCIFGVVTQYITISAKICPCRTFPQGVTWLLFLAVLAVGAAVEGLEDNENFAMPTSVYTPSQNEIDPGKKLDIKLILEPVNPVVQTNYTLQLNCTMEGSVTHTWEDLYFRFGSVEYNSSSPYVQMMDNTTIQLNMPNMQRNISDRLWFCYLRGEDAFGMQTVIVADPPVTPVLQECRVHNWLSMTCTWLPEEQNTGLTTKQNLFWTLLWLNNDPSWYLCPRTILNTCVWSVTSRPASFHPALTYAVFLEAESELGKVISGVHFIHTILQVEPDPVKDLGVLSTTKTSTFMMLSWVSPKPLKTLIYNLEYKSLRRNEELFPAMSVNTSDLELNLTDLLPYTTYNICISAIPVVTNKGQGFWSKVRCIEETTLEDVPSINPEMAPGAFHVVRSRDQMNRIVRIYWKKLPDYVANGQVPSYDLIIRGNKEEIEERPPGHDYYDDATLHKDDEYHVELYAKTAMGRNTSIPPSKLIILREADLLKTRSLGSSDFVSIALTNTEVMCNWTQIDQAESYTLFWCQGNTQGYMCHTDIDWLNFDANVTSHSLVLDDVYSKYIFALAVNYKLDLAQSVLYGRQKREIEKDTLVSSGIEWNSCTYNMETALAEPKNFAMSKHQEGGKISIEWSGAECSETGYFDSFSIFYCKDSNCPDTTKSVIVNRSANAYTITDVEDQKSYRVWIQANSPFEESKATPYISIKVKKSGMTTAEVIGISFAVFILLILILFGIYSIFKHFRKRYKDLHNLDITVPVRPDDEDALSDDQPSLSSNEYRTFNTSAGSRVSAQNRANIAREQDPVPVVQTNIPSYINSDFPKLRTPDNTGDSLPMVEMIPPFAPNSPTKAGPHGDILPAVPEDGLPLPGPPSQTTPPGLPSRRGPLPPIPLQSFQYHNTVHVNPNCSPDQQGSVSPFSVYNKVHLNSKLGESSRPSTSPAPSIDEDVNSTSNITSYVQAIPGALSCARTENNQNLDTSIGSEMIRVDPIRRDSGTSYESLEESEPAVNLTSPDPAATSRFIPSDGYISNNAFDLSARFEKPCFSEPSHLGYVDNMNEDNETRIPDNGMHHEQLARTDLVYPQDQQENYVPHTNCGLALEVNGDSSKLPSPSLSSTGTGAYIQSPVTYSDHESESEETDDLLGGNSNGINPKEECMPESPLLPVASSDYITVDSLPNTVPKDVSCHSPHDEPTDPTCSTHLDSISEQSCSPPYIAATAAQSIPTDSNDSNPHEISFNCTHTSPHKSNLNPSASNSSIKSAEQSLSHSPADDDQSMDTYNTSSVVPLSQKTVPYPDPVHLDPVPLVNGYAVHSPDEDSILLLEKAPEEGVRNIVDSDRSHNASISLNCAC